jgi:site-specific DNA recombinase
MPKARSVTVIQPTVAHVSLNVPDVKAKKRVAAYARVSTENEEQLSSYEAQVDYYTRHIQSNADWEFAGIYTDEGISATNTKKREGFKRMIVDALDGKIDLILTKSVSRFARNTVDTLITVRQLKEKGVEVYFEKENIYTLDSKGELLITIMSSLAQEESRSISENVTWGQRKRFADGKVSLPYKRFLGYEKGANGSPQIVEEQAKVVRLIYKMFLEGNTIPGIAQYLTNQKIPTPAGKEKWQSSTVQSILTNEKYKGDAVLQKTFTVDFLTKKMKPNEGEVPQYYVENSHPAIISSEVFDLVQHELKKWKNIGYTCHVSCFSGRIICGECGCFYGSKVWHSTSKYRRMIWQCNGKFKNQEKCRTPHLDDETIKRAFIEVFNDLIENKNEILNEYKTIINSLTDTTELEAKRAELQRDNDILLEMIRKSIEKNTRSALNQENYQMAYDELVSGYEDTKIRLDKINDHIFNNSIKSEKLMDFINTLKKTDNLLEEFNELLWNTTVESVTVLQQHELVFTFKDGSEVKHLILK